MRGRGRERREKRERGGEVWREGRKVVSPNLNECAGVFDQVTLPLPYLSPSN